MNFREYILKIALSRSIFSAQNALNSELTAGLRPDPLGELTALPRPPSRIKGSLLLREWDGKGLERGEKRPWERKW